MVVESRSVKKKCEKRAGAGERQGGDNNTSVIMVVVRKDVLNK